MLTILSLKYLFWICVVIYTISIIFGKDDKAKDYIFYTIGIILLVIYEISLQVSGKSFTFIGIIDTIGLMLLVVFGLAMINAGINSFKKGKDKIDVFLNIIIGTSIIIALYFYW